MATEDQTHWDQKYGSNDPDNQAENAPDVPRLPKHFEPHAAVLADAQHVLEIACGTGRTAVWLAQRGARVEAYDISPIAIAKAEALAAATGVADRCIFATADLDDGLPPGHPADLVVCNLFRDASLDEAIMHRLAAGGLLAVAVLSEVGAGPGRFRAKPGELLVAFASLELVASDEGDGLAWLIARKET